MYGERFIEHKIEGNKIIRISEFKNFDYDYKELIEDLMDYVTDEWEALNDYEIYFNRNEDIDTFEVDSVLEWVEELIEEYIADGEEPEDFVWLTKWVKPLEEAKGFCIHINYKPEWIKNG